MAKNFLDEDYESSKARLSYSDGFRFGFGFFLANLIGASVLGLIATGVAYATRVLH